MIKVRFLSFIARNLGTKEIELEKKKISLAGLLDYLRERFPDHRDLFESETPELTIIVDGKSLYLPTDLEQVIENEVVISPIIAGGYY